jgi:hypothetical protein
MTESWDDYRFNGYRKALEEHRDMWIATRNLASAQGNDYTYMDASGRVEGYEAALRLLEVWVKGIQEEEANDR